MPETEDYHELLEAFADGKSRPLNTAAGRDGLFEARDMFVIYEKPDLLDLKVLIDAALLVAGPLQE